MSVLSELETLERRHDDHFHDVGDRIARGETVDPAEALDAIRQANKTRDDLKRYVTQQQRLAELQAAVAAGKEADERLPEVVKSIQALIDERQAAFDEASRVCAEKGAPLEAEKARLIQLQVQATAAAGELGRMQERVTPEQFEQRRAQQQAAVAALAPPPAPARKPDPTGWEPVQPGVIH